ncbi:hypothetical protein FOZ60_013013 [Perkinsus olseni]|uniref:MULE transposase domain-containing protein n=1 Tax=Perkinsus olseni TaxID=32597 RepID=A0A7J6NA40_PEROL|nr:hypothetical protein FOZ60_013013 [Perkinsus olseni]
MSASSHMPIPSSSESSSTLSAAEISTVRKMINSSSPESRGVISSIPSSIQPLPSVPAPRRDILYLGEKRKYKSEGEAVTALASLTREKMTKKGNYSMRDGTYVLRYQCGAARRRGYSCPYTAQVRRKNSEWEVFLPQPPHHLHMHSTEPAVPSGPILSEAAKRVVLEQLKDGIKPRGTTRSLRERGLLPENGTVTSAQVTKAVYNARSYMKQQFEESEGGTGCTVASIRAFAEANSDIPADENKAFCPDYEIIPGKSYYFVFSCMRLLRENTKYKVITCDYTAAPSWLGLPLLIVGGLDEGGRFHPIVFAITSDETHRSIALVFSSIKRHAELVGCCFDPTILVADKADAFSNAYREVISGNGGKMPHRECSSSSSSSRASTHRECSSMQW